MGFLDWLLGERPGFFSRTIHTSQGTGSYGEYLTRRPLTDHNIDGRFVSFSNLILPHRGRTTEIDDLILHEKGIFVFESKNLSGWIFGSADQKQWTQSLKGGKKYHFANPVKQNREHVKALAETLGLPLSAFRSFIVFSNRCELKSVPSNTSEYAILKRLALVSAVSKEINRRELLFDDAQFESLKAHIEELQRTQVSRREHIENVRRLNEGEICPVCGGELVTRQGKYGAFKGCSNYPDCHFTRPL